VPDNVTLLGQVSVCEWDMAVLRVMNVGVYSEF